MLIFTQLKKTITEAALQKQYSLNNTRFTLGAIALTIQPITLPDL